MSTAKVNILVMAAMHERPLVSELWALSVMEMIKANPQYNFRVVSLVSDIESAAVCRTYGIDEIPTIKAPLGTKMNTGMQIALETYDFDYLMQFGDDDVCDPLLPAIYSDEIKNQTPYFGVKQLYFLDTLTSMAAWFTYSQPTNKLVGAGRMFLKDALLKTAFQVDVLAMKNGNYCGVKLEKGHIIKLPLYQAEYLQALHHLNIISGSRFRLFRDDQVSGLDHQSETGMVMNNYSPVVVDTDIPVITDVKSHVNIWKYDQFANLGKPVMASDAMQFWPESVRKYYVEMVDKLKKQL